MNEVSEIPEATCRAIALQCAMMFFDISKARLTDPGQVEGIADRFIEFIENNGVGHLRIELPENLS